MFSQDLKKLRDWFVKNAAELPWRSKDLNALRDPYVVWISETMLQQTQVSTVRDYFIRWMERFPDLRTLAKASDEEVFKYWQGLGYYSRARNILKTARIVAGTDTTSEAVAEPTLNLHCEMPRTRSQLEALPGIGAYTAGAILSLAYHQKEAILDGNLVRIFSRYYALDFLPTDKGCADIYWNYAREVADSAKANLHNEALMELGRRVCKVKNPECENCPLKGGCKAFANNSVLKYPPAKKHLQKDWHGVVLIVESKDHKILAIHGHQKFFSNQLALPHFETVRSAPEGLPAVAEDLINFDEVSSIENVGSIRHNITVHKITCDVLHVLLNVNSSKAQVNHPDFQWIEKASVSETLANSFSLKSLEKINQPQA